MEPIPMKAGRVGRTRRYAERVWKGKMTLERAVADFVLVDGIITPANAKRRIETYLEYLEKEEQGLVVQ